MPVSQFPDDAAIASATKQSGISAMDCFVGFASSHDGDTTVDLL
jgi:hypothetical protein